MVVVAAIQPKTRSVPSRGRPRRPIRPTAGPTGATRIRLHGVIPTRRGVRLVGMKLTRHGVRRVGILAIRRRVARILGLARIRITARRHPCPLDHLPRLRRLR